MAVESASTPLGCRSRFPIFERLVYINSCSQGALSHEVREAYETYLRDWDERGAPWDYWIERADDARASFAGLIGARPMDVAATTSVSAAVSAIATGVDLRDRPRIVVTDLEFPTIGQIWHAQEARGAEVVHVAFDEVDSGLEQLARVLDDRTALVSVTGVCYRNGVRLPIEEIAAVARSHGALVLVDAYQGLGTYPIDVGALDVDFITGGTLKYLLGSPGLAFLWARAAVVESIVPLATGWFADRDIFEMDVGDYSPAATARRFEAGTPAIPSIYAGVAGMQIVAEIGIDSIAAHITRLNTRLIAGLQEIGASVPTPADPDGRAALVCVRSTDAPELVRRLAADDIVTSERDGNLRISAHVYNTDDDVDAVLASIERHPELLAG